MFFYRLSQSHSVQSVAPFYFLKPNSIFVTAYLGFEIFNPVLNAASAFLLSVTPYLVSASFVMYVIPFVGAKSDTSNGELEMFVSIVRFHMKTRLLEARKREGECDTSFLSLILCSDNIWSFFRRFLLVNIIIVSVLNIVAFTGGSGFGHIPV